MALLESSPIFFSVPFLLFYLNIRSRGLGVLLKDQEFFSVREKKRREKAVNDRVFIDREKPASI